MRIVRIEPVATRIRLSEPYRIAYDEFHDFGCVFLEIVTDGRHVGRGCAAPDPHVTGETAEGLLELLDGVVSERLEGLDPLRPARVLADLAEPLADAPGACAAVDLALHDLLGKQAGMPVWRLLGGYRSRIATSVTIGIVDEKETVRQAREFIDAGFRALKIKGGVSMEEDVERLRQVRRAVGEEVGLRFDANQGFDVDTSLRFVEAVRDLDLEVVEQPVPKEAVERLARVTRRSPQPIMADESLLTLRDAFRLGRDEIVDMLNIKLMKVGGIAAGMRVDAVARAARMETMVGCMDEPALGIAAGLALALASPNIALADLDGHLDLAEDPTSSAVRLEAGFLYPSEEPGLGLV